MALEGKVTFQGDGMGISVRAMNADIHRIKIHTDNIAQMDIPGYQSKKPVVTSFVEYLGANAIDSVVNTEVGRVRKTENPLDLAINAQGYFQRLSKGGRIELSRDGRMKIDKEGYLLSLDNKFILSDAGLPIKLSTIPTDQKRDLAIGPDGSIQVYDDKLSQMVYQGRIHVVDENGITATQGEVAQGYVESSNVMLQQEFVGAVPLRREFEANRQLFLIQSDVLSRTVQELGRQ